MSGIYDFSILAGGSQRFTVYGGKAKIISASFPIALKIRLDGGDAYSCLEGQGVSLPDGKSFGDVTIQNPSAVTQSGYVFIGSTDFEDTRVTGNVRVIDEITDRIVMALPSGPLGINVWATTQVIDPTLNVRGAIVRASQVSSQAGASGFVNNGLIACKSAPTAFAVPVQQYAIASLSNSTTAPVNSVFQTSNKYLPPGWGVWLYSSVQIAAAGNNSGLLSYELL